MRIIMNKGGLMVQKPERVNLIERNRPHLHSVRHVSRGEGGGMGVKEQPMVV
jgi:hypothetical protein